MAAKKDKNMSSAAQTPTQTHAPKTEKAPKKRVADTRSPEVIFKERFNSEARLMTRRFAALRQLGNAKRAAPTPEMLQQAAEWLRSETEKTIEEMGAKLSAPKNLKEQARDTGFKAI